MQKIERSLVPIKTASLLKSTELGTRRDVSTPVEELNIARKTNAEYAANRDYTDYEKFGSIIFCNTSFNSRIESANYAKQMELYISGKEADLSEWDTAIKDYENERSKCRDFNP